MISSSKCYASAGQLRSCLFGLGEKVEGVLILEVPQIHFSSHVSFRLGSDFSFVCFFLLIVVGGSRPATRAVKWGT